MNTRLSLLLHDQAITIADAFDLLKVLQRQDFIMPHDLDRAVDRLGAMVLTYQLASNEEDGFVAVVESGVDCDGVEYSGRVHTIEATIEAYEAKYDSVAEWADGPFRFELCKPSEARRVEYSSRDLVMEAHEEGHPHHIVSSF